MSLMKPPCSWTPAPRHLMQKYLLAINRTSLNPMYVCFSCFPVYFRSNILLAADHLMLGYLLNSIQPLDLPNKSIFLNSLKHKSFQS